MFYFKYRINGHKDTQVRVCSLLKSIRLKESQAPSALWDSRNKRALTLFAELLAVLEFETISFSTKMRKKWGKSQSTDQWLFISSKARYSDVKVLKILKRLFMHSSNRFLSRDICVTSISKNIQCQEPPSDLHYPL